MISNKNVHSFMKQLIEKVFENEHLDYLLETEIDNLKGFKLPKKVNHKELLLKVSALGLITIEKVNGKTVHIELTESGKLYFETKKQQKQIIIIDWIRYGITTLIALTSLFISLYNLGN